MSTKKYLIQTLEACEKHEFDTVVKAYLKEVYNYFTVVMTDGNNDSGLDLRVFDTGKQKIQYQLTVQNSETSSEKSKFDSKLIADLIKAERNVNEYGYSTSLFFFYSKKMSNKSMNEWAKKALKDYNITLTILDANRIAEDAENHLTLLKTITDTNPIDQLVSGNSLFPDNEKSLVFDLVGFGKTVDFKFQIVESFILKQLYISKELTLNDIVSICRDQFKSKDNDVFYKKLMDTLQSQRRVAMNVEKTHYILKSDEQDRIQKLLAKYEVDEKSFKLGVLKILTFYQQGTYLEEYIIELKKIYIQNFNNDILGTLNNSISNDLSKVSREFLIFVTNKGVTEEKTLELARKLFSFCKENNFLQKFCAGKVYSETTNLHQIEQFINKKKKVFIDTQLALHSLCYFYNPKSDYSNYYYNNTKSLLEFCRSNKIKLHIPDRYLWEAQNHLRECLNLIPFTRLPNFEKLGKSRNVFYNFFLFERINYEGKEFYLADFFKKFGFSVFDKYTKHNELIQHYLDNLNINLEYINQEYDIDDTRILMQTELIVNNRHKTKFSLINDCIVFEYLSDSDPDVQPLQPILLSWDKILFKCQEEFFSRNKTAKRWYLFTPGWFIDQYSLLQFSIDSSVLTNEILAFLSDEIIQKTHSLLDTISFILNPDDQIGLEYTNKLATIRDNEIHRLKEHEVILPRDIESEAVIDDVFYKLTNHYQEEKGNLEGFKQVFTSKAYMDDVLKIINEAVNDFYSTKRFNEKIYTEFDKIIVSVKDDLGKST